MEEEIKKEETKELKGYSIASMVLGIVSLVFLVLWYISLPSAILAIIFAIIGMKKGGKGMAIAGLVTGIVAIALYIMLIVFTIVSVSLFI